MSGEDAATRRARPRGHVGAGVVVVVVLMLVAAPVLAPAAQAAPADPQVADPAGDVEGPDGQSDRGPADDWADVLAVWVAGETAEALEFHVEVPQLPPAWNEATQDRPAEPYRVAYDVEFFFVRPGVPGVEGFEEGLRTRHLLTVIVSRGVNTEKIGNLLVGGEGCRWNGEPGSGTAERASNAEVLCRVPRELVLPDEAGGTFYAGDRLADFNVTATQDVPELVDAAVGQRGYAFEVVEPLPAPEGDDGGGGGATGDGGTGGAGGSGDGSAADGGDGDGNVSPGDGTDAGPADDDAGSGGAGSAGGEATPAPGASAMVVAALAAVLLLRGRRRGRP